MIGRARGTKSDNPHAVQSPATSWSQRTGSGRLYAVGCLRWGSGVWVAANQGEMERKE